MDEVRKERPRVITIISVLGFLSAVNLSMNAFSPLIRGLGTSFQAYYIIAALVSLCASIGLWRMKKWGAILYALLTLANLTVLLLMGRAFNRYVVIFSAALAVLLVIVCFSQFRKMD